MPRMRADEEDQIESVENRESINPARQKAHAAAPARKASPRETNSDFQEILFKGLLEGLIARIVVLKMRPAREAVP